VVVVVVVVVLVEVVVVVVSLPMEGREDEGRTGEVGGKMEWSGVEWGGHCAVGCRAAWWMRFGGVQEEVGWPIARCAVGSWKR
jgi:hypothetical protein